MQFRERRSLTMWRLHEFSRYSFNFFVILFCENHFCSFAKQSSSVFIVLELGGPQKARVSSLESLSFRLKII